MPQRIGHGANGHKAGISGVETESVLRQSSREKDYWAAGRMMADDLTQAGIAAPVWPRTPTIKETPATTPLKAYARDLDDEVPF